MNISVVGLGKLGLCTAACFAARGHKVTGFDKDETVSRALLKGECPLDENGLVALLDEGRDNLSITTDLEGAFLGSEITLIIVPTPSQADGAFGNHCVEEVLQGIAPLLARKDRFHIVDVVSTVMPGSCEGSFKSILERGSGKTCCKDFGLVYNPEFIALGSVIKDFLNPDMILIGASDDLSASRVKELYLATCDNRPHVAAMSLINAEIAKLSINCYVTMKISFANELASLCERIAGADIDTISAGLGLDTRIGGKYLKGGLGFGGPCFPRDNLAFQRLCKLNGIEAGLAPEVMAINDSVADRVLDMIAKETKGGERIALLGMSYKPETHIIEGSQSITVAQKLADSGYRVSAHDPKALEAAGYVLGPAVELSKDPYSCVEEAEAIILLTPWKLYEELDWKRIAKPAEEHLLLLVDCWRVVKEPERSLFRYRGLGIGPVGPTPLRLSIQGLE